MFLVRPVPQAKTLNVVSLPRDTKIYLDAEQSQVAKLNAAHSIGGPEKTQTVLQNSFGVPIHRYIAVDFQAIRAMIDAVGGVDVYIEKRMHYNDFTAKLFINFEKGWHHLDGKQAEAFVRFRRYWANSSATNFCRCLKTKTSRPCFIVAFTPVSRNYSALYSYQYEL
jgi:LCP family protein required for cell wall assembly